MADVRRDRHRRDHRERAEERLRHRAQRKHRRGNIDGTLYETITPQTLTSGEQWAFDHAFYVLFDLAIGGSWAGPPNASTFPAKMLVDWVRVYRKG